MEKLFKLYEHGTDVKEWELENDPDPELIYKEGLPYQSKAALALSDIVSKLSQPKVVSYHKSKSVKLPVMMYKFDFYRDCKAICFIRNNFYDIKLSVVSNTSISIPYDLIHGLMTQEDYDKEKKRKVEYSKDYENPEYKTDDWFHNNWTSDKLIRRGKEIWRAYTVHKVYCEGINKIEELSRDVFEPYHDDAKKFTISLRRYPQLALVLEHISTSLGKGQRSTSSHNMDAIEHSTLLYLIDSIMVAEEKLSDLLSLAQKENGSEKYKKYLERLASTQSKDLKSVCEKIKKEIK